MAKRDTGSGIRMTIPIALNLLFTHILEVLTRALALELRFWGLGLRQGVWWVKDISMWAMIGRVTLQGQCRPHRRHSLRLREQCMRSIPIW